MKKKNVFLVGLFAVVLLPTLAAAEDQTTKEAQNAISIDVLLPILLPVSLLWEGGETDVIIPINILYQRVISDHFMALIKAGLNYSWYRYTTPQNGWMEVYPAVEVDWHPFHKGLKGFYVGLSGIFDYGVDCSDAAAKGTSYSYAFGWGLSLGWLFLLPAHINIDLVVGQGAGYLVSVDASGVTTSGFSEVPARTGVFLGYRF